MALSDDPLGLGIPPGRRLQLPGRGTTFVREVPGPAGAPTLVLLHGLGATAAVNWFACFAALGLQFRVLALDQRGHGRGIRPGLRGFRLQDCADDVVALADAVGVDRMIPVGYSMGGPVGQLVWKRHPERVAGLVLCATARSFRGTRRPDVVNLAFATGIAAASAALRLVPPSVRRQVLRVNLNRRVGDRDAQAWIMGELKYSDPSAILEAAGALGQFASNRWIGEVNVPAAVVVTTRDRLVAPARQYRLAESIPGALVFPVAGDHSACATAAGVFVPALVEACSSVTASVLRGG